MKHFVNLPYLLSMYSTSSGRGFLPLVTAAHEISPTCSCMRNPGEGRVCDTHPCFKSNVRGTLVSPSECSKYHTLQKTGQSVWVLEKYSGFRSCFILWGKTTNRYISKNSNKKTTRVSSNHWFCVPHYKCFNDQPTYSQVVYWMKWYDVFIFHVHYPVRCSGHLGGEEVSAQGGVHLPPVNRMTDRWKNITFPQLPFADDKKYRKKGNVNQKLLSLRTKSKRT